MILIDNETIEVTTDELEATVKSMKQTQYKYGYENAKKIEVECPRLSLE